jgi:1-deoxy-D-xylulose-5-phosphate reductoisomerase
MKKNLSILGSTGSVGQNILSVVRNFPNFFKIESLAVDQNIEEVEKQIQEFNPKIVSVYDSHAAKQLKKKLIHTKWSSVKILEGLEGMEEISTSSSLDLLLVASSGHTAFFPTLKAIQNNINIAIATKEIIVAAGPILLEEAKKHNVQILPMDSEHNALFQLLQNEKKQTVSKLILTASGGPFFNVPYENLKNIKSKEALKHPTYSMGKKNSIDSATLMNKGLEVIEAAYLFGMDKKNIEIVVHPQSIVHAMIEFNDQSLFAFLSKPNMQIPIQHVLFYPERKETFHQPMTWDKMNSLNFYPVPKDDHFCYSLAYEALEIGKSMPCFLSMANEEIVKLFLNDKIHFLDIQKMLKKWMTCHKTFDLVNWEGIQEVQKEIKHLTRNLT